MNVRVDALYWTDERYVNKRPTMVCLAGENNTHKKTRFCVDKAIEYL